MNLFSISTVILCLSGIVFSLIIYRTDRTNVISKAWFNSCILFSLWALGLSGVTLSQTSTVAYYWQYLLDVAGIFLPYFYFIFLLNLLGFKAKLIRNIFFVCAVVFSIFSFSPLFKIGMSIKYGFQWIDPGPYYVLFLVYFAIYAFLSFGLLIYGYTKTQRKSVLRSQIRNTIFGAIMGFGGGVTNFFPQMFSIYPYGNYLVILYIVFMVYGVLRYKFLSAKVVGAQVFSMAIILISLFNLLKTNDTADWFLNFFILVLIGIFSIFLIRSINKEVSQREKIELLASDLKAANDNQVNLIHIMNHQIKGRFSDTKAAFAGLLEGDYGELSEDEKKVARGGMDAAETGVTYVQGILRGLSAENGTLPYDMKELDLRESVKTIAEKLKAKATEKKLAYEMNIAEGDFKVTGDKVQLGEAIGNLINNSISYTPTGSIHVWLTKKGNKALFAVQDTGIGITEEDKPRLFKSGGRGKDSIKVNVNSTGYGLSFVKGVVDAHKGRVWVESDGPGKGSSFYMELPLAENR